MAQEATIEREIAEHECCSPGTSAREVETDRDLSNRSVPIADKSIETHPSRVVGQSVAGPTKPNRSVTPAVANSNGRATKSSEESHTDPRELAFGISYRYCPQSAIDSALARLADLAQAASQGDKQSLDRLRQALNNSQAWRLIADLQLAIEARMADKLAPHDVLRREAFLKRSSELRSNLAGEDSSMMVKLAASRVVACWVFAQFLELRLLEAGEVPANLKLLDQAERRIDTAMRSLSNARKLELQLRSAGRQ